ncbi:MAG: enoyl-CoA hydratase/isomerase family protein [Pigmentiphaga sp.]
MSELLVENQGALRILRMNRPEKHNALNTALTQALFDALLTADRDRSVNAIVLTGEGKSFCAGADTKEFSSLVPDDPQAVRDRGYLTTNLHACFSQLSKPVIAAVEGNALGGGAGLAIACDLVVASESTRYGYPELKHGIVAAVVMSNLVRQLGRKKAFQLLALCEPLSGTQMAEWGLANWVTPAGQALEKAIEVAQTLAGWKPIAVSTTKQLFHRVAELTLQEGLEAGRDTNMLMRGFRQEDKA